MAQSIAKLEVSEQQRQELLRVVRASSSSQRDARRARIVLLRGEGKSEEETAREVGVNRPVVGVWERRFRSQGLAGLSEGSFSSVRDLTLAIEIYLAQRNLDPKPYRWRAKGADILAKIHRAREAMAAQGLAAAGLV